MLGEPIRKWIVECLPNLGAGRHLGIVEQAAIEDLTGLFRFEILADKHNLLAAVAVLTVKLRLNAGTVFQILRPMLARCGGPPYPGRAVPCDAAGLRPFARCVVPRGKPEEAL